MYTGRREDVGAQFCQVIYSITRDISLAVWISYIQVGSPMRRVPFEILAYLFHRMEISPRASENRERNEFEQTARLYIVTEIENFNIKCLRREQKVFQKLCRIIVGHWYRLFQS